MTFFQDIKKYQESGFSHKKVAEFAILKALDREKQLAKTNPDHAIKFPAETSAAKAPTPNYTALKIRIEKKTKDLQALALERRNKLK